MTITPDQAHQWAQEATDGPWHVHTDPADPDGTFIYDEIGNMCIAVEPSGSAYLAADLDLAAAAPDLAQTVAGMTEVWAVEERADDGGWWRITTWHMNREDLDSFHGRPGHRLVRRLVGPVEVVGDE